MLDAGGSGEAFEQAFAGAGPTLEKIKQLKKDGPKKEHQPGGKDLDIFGLFKGALGAIGELWAYGLKVREASGEHDAELSWGIKKTHRIWYKWATKYNGDLTLGVLDLGISNDADLGAVCQRVPGVIW